MSWGDYWCLPFHLCICLRAGEQTQLILTSWSIYWAVHLVLSGIARVGHAIFKNTSLWHYTPGRGICAQIFYCHLSVRTSEEGTSNYKVTEKKHGTFSPIVLYLKQKIKKLEVENDPGWPSPSHRKWKIPLYFFHFLTLP